MVRELTGGEEIWQLYREELATPSLASTLLDARLCGRHGCERSVVLQGVLPTWFTPEQKLLIFAAYAQGLQDRRAGRVCFCTACITPLPEFPQASRIEYRSRRYAELALSGVDHDTALGRIEQEMKRRIG